MFLSRIQGYATVVKPTITLDAVPDDPDDNRVLECALAGDADFIVTGDKHLLRLGAYKHIPILTVRKFLQATRLIES